MEVRSSQLLVDVSDGVGAEMAQRVEQEVPARQMETRNFEARIVEAKNLEARNLDTRSLEDRNLETRNLEANSLEARTFEARDLEAAAGLEIDAVGANKSNLCREGRSYNNYRNNRGL
jgi:hypothetical protein